VHQLEQSKSGGWLLLVILIGVPFSIIGIAALLSEGINIETLLFSGCFLSIGLIVLSVTLLGLARRMYYGPPEIAISKMQVGVGEEFAMTYRHEFKRNIAVKKYIFRLIMRESATYQRGTDTVTVTHDHKVDEFGYPPQTFPRGHVIEDQWSVKIPPSGMHTFEARRNKIQWFIQIEIDGPGPLDIKNDYEVKVSPQVVQ
jgi:hypothetical protein